MVVRVASDASLLPQGVSSFQSVMLAYGEGDDALIYQAPVGQIISEDSFIVRFHDGSLMLERVKLFGALRVHVIFSEEAQFLGELIPMRDSGFVREDALMVRVELALDDPVESSDRLHPMT